MYQVLIADDEPSVSQSLVVSTNWKQYNCNVAGVVYSGREALDLIRNIPIDIVILDIRMPDINGLELCEIISREFPSIIRIIISGYAEFSYAQKAMNFGVEGYCLKPIDYKEIEYILKKSTNKLQNTISNDSMERLMDSIELSDFQTLELILSNQGMISNQYYIVASTGDKPVDINQNSGISIQLGRNQYGYIMKTPLSEDLLKLYSNETYISCISYQKEPITIKDIRAAIKECSNMAYQFFINPNCRINNTPTRSLTALILAKARKICSYGNQNSIIELLKSIMKNDYMNIFDIRSALQLSNIIFSSSIFQETKGDYYVYSFNQLVTEYKTFENLLKTLQILVYETQIEIHDLNISNNSFLQLMKYIQDNYTKEISLTEIATVLHMNPNYISQMFKRENGITFTHYITKLRIKDATELLCTTDLSISDISVEIGFNDYFYFLKTFKKMTGKTPSQYRQTPIEFSENKASFDI